MVPVTPQPTRATTDAFYPLILNSGRIRDQWHTMTRTGAVPRLMQHIAEPVVEVAPADAVRYQLPRRAGADLVAAWGDGGESGDQRRAAPGSLFVPMHWNNQFARRGRVNNLLAAVTDPYSGQPESKQAAVAIAAWQPAWHSELFAANRFRFLRPGTGGGGRRGRALSRWPGRHLPDSGSARGAPARQAGGCGGAVWNLLAWHQGRLMLGWWSDAREPAVDAAWISARFLAAVRCRRNDMPCLAADRAARRAPGADRLQLLWRGGTVN
jgi:assimilatory nitrate reductase catalytic subunit